MARPPAGPRSRTAAAPGATGGLVLLLLAGCGACLQPDPGLKVVVPAMPSTLDWSTSDANSWVNYPAILATMRGLTELGPDNAPRPGIARSWTRERTPEGHERYVFQLREDVRWSDGVTSVLAQDFVTAWRRAVVGRERGELADVLGAPELLELQARGRTPTAEDLERLAVRALGPHTLEVVLGAPRSYFLARMANVYLFFPAPTADLAGLSEEARRDYFDRPRDGKPMAVGPFRVERWDRAAERVRLVRNPSSAFAPPLGPSERPVEVVTLLRSEVGPALYQRGRVGFVFVDSAIALQRARLEDLQRRELLSTYFLAFNTTRPPLDDAAVRRALARALDRDALTAGLLPAARPTLTLLPANLPLAARPEEAARLPRFEPEEARRALQGRVGRPLRLVYRAGESFVPEVALAERLKAQLGAVGVEVALEPRFDFSAELARLAPDGHRAPDLYLRRLGADYAHPNTFFTYFEASGSHHTGWERQDGGRAIARFGELLARADAEADPERARVLYVEAQQLLVGEQAVIAPIFHPDRYFRVRQRLVGLDVDPFNFLSLREVRERAEPR